MWGKSYRVEKSERQKLELKQSQIEGEQQKKKKHKVKKGGKIVHKARNFANVTRF